MERRIIRDAPLFSIDIAKARSIFVLSIKRKKTWRSLSFLDTGFLNCLNHNSPDAHAL